MSHLPKNLNPRRNGVESLAHFAQHRAQEAFRAGRDYTKENPVPLVLGALLIGVGVGVLCGRRDPKPHDAAHVAREMMEEAFARVVEKLPSFRTRPSRPEALLGHLAGFGRSLRWW